MKQLWKKFHFCTCLSCSEQSPASYCYQIDIKNQARGNVMTAEICFKVFSSERGEWVGKEMKENRPWFDNCELRKLSVLPLHAMATAWVGSLLPGLWLHFLKLNDATKHFDSKGFLHKPLGSVKTWAACLWICIPGTWQAARCLAPYWHQNTGCLTSMLTIQSAQLRWQTLKSKLARRKHCIF